MHDPSACPAFHDAVELIGRRWNGLILRELLAGPRRFSQVRAGIPGITDAMLSQRLKELEAARLVKRTASPDEATGDSTTRARAGGTRPPGARTDRTPPAAAPPDAAQAMPAPPDRAHSMPALPDRAQAMAARTAATPLDEDPTSIAESAITRPATVRPAPTRPGTTGYALTAEGRSLAPVLDAIARWSVEWTAAPSAAITTATPTGATEPPTVDRSETNPTTANSNKPDPNKTNPTKTNPNKTKQEAA